MKIPTVDFVLPGNWWRVPLDSAESIRSSARALAVETFGRSDEHARIRAQMIADVVAAAESARTIDGQDFFFALELAPGERVPLSLTTSFPMMDVVPSRAAAPRLAAQVLAAKLESQLDDSRVDVLDMGDDFGVARTVDEVRGSAPGEDAAHLPRLTVNYWLLSTESPRALVMSFATPLVEAQEEVLLLTEAIVSSVMWREGERARNG